MLIVSIAICTWRYKAEEVKKIVRQQGAICINADTLIGPDRGKGKGKAGKQGVRKPPHFEPPNGFITDMELRQQALPEFFQMLKWRSS